jgi:hypothetical protein
VPITKVVSSLLDEMRDGNEYGSIVSCTSSSSDLVPELRRAIRELEAVRGRRCLCYVANLVQDNMGQTSIAPADHLPFSEMVSSVPKDCEDIDVFLATPGGSGEQVTQFVDALRLRFKTVEFLIPYKAMSAGTLWALSGDRIWMDQRACLGPIDPQVPSKDGRYVPAQALLTLLRTIQREGQEALAKGGRPDWTHLQIVNSMDYRQLGAAMTASDYSINMARRFLNDFKFKGWLKHSSSGAPVTPAERLARADAVARQLCDHDRWKVHAHSLTREVIEKELKSQILIDQPEAVAGLERALRRLWALCCFVFDRTPTSKVILSGEYSFVRSTLNVTGVPAAR